MESLPACTAELPRLLKLRSPRVGGHGREKGQRGPLIVLMAYENYISNSSHEVLFLLSNLVYASFGLESFFGTVEINVFLHYPASYDHIS